MCGRVDLVKTNDLSTGGQGLFFLSGSLRGRLGPPITQMYPCVVP